MEKKGSKWAMTSLGILMVATLVLSMFLTIFAGTLLIGTSIFEIDKQSKFFDTWAGYSKWACRSLVSQHSHSCNNLRQATL